MFTHKCKRCYDFLWFDYYDYKLWYIRHCRIFNILQQQRERGLPVFDADAQMNQLAQKFWGDSWENEVKQKEPAYIWTLKCIETKAIAEIELHVICPSLQEILMEFRCCRKTKNITPKGSPHHTCHLEKPGCWIGFR